MVIFSYNPVRRLCQKGSVLVLVLMILSGMMILSLSLAYKTRVEMKTSVSNARRTYAYYLALGGIEVVKMRLREADSASEIAGMCFVEMAAQEDGLFDGLAVDDDELSLTYCLRDELSCFNVNRSDPGAWNNIEGLSPAIQASILDWIDSDDYLNPDGAETDYYQLCEPAYVAKNGDLSVLRELLYVRDVSSQIYIGEDTNHNGMLDENEKDGFVTQPRDNGDSVLNFGLIDLFTVYGDGRVNINTVSSTILAALPGLDEQAAQIIVDYRVGVDGIVGTEDDLYVEGISQLSESGGLTQLQLDLLQEYCCYTSSYYRVFSRATVADDVDCVLMATLCCDDSGPEIVCLEQLP